MWNYKTTDAKDRSTLQSLENCQHCQIRRSDWFCNLSPEPLAEYDAIGTAIALPTGSILFSEGQLAHYVSTLCSGRVKLIKTSRTGKTVLVKIAQPGDILGLSAALAESNYEVTAQAIEPSYVKSFHNKDFRHFIGRYPEGSLHTAESLNSEYRSVLKNVSRLALSNTVAGRIAHLLLDPRNEIHPGPVAQSEVHMPLKHEDLAAMLGSSRESVTRALNDLRRQGIIAIKGTKVTILRRAALELLL